MVKLMIDDRHELMPWDDIDAVVFDVGNVLLRYSVKDILARILPDRPDLHPVLTARVYQSPYWVMRDRGSITAGEALDAMTAGNPSLLPYARHALEGWWDIPEIEEGVAALKACHAHGKKLYVLSNYADDAFTYAETNHDFFDLFDQKFVSSRLHMVKPDQSIYRHVTNALGIAPERILFIDDSIANIEAALDFGWQCLRYSAEGQLQNFFAK